MREQYIRTIQNNAPPAPVCYLDYDNPRLFDVCYIYGYKTIESVGYPSGRDVPALRKYAIPTTASESGMQDLYDKSVTSGLQVVVSRYADDVLERGGLALYENIQSGDYPVVPLDTELCNGLYRKILTISEQETRSDATFDDIVLNFVANSGICYDVPAESRTLLREQLKLVYKYWYSSSISNAPVVHAIVRKVVPASPEVAANSSILWNNRTEDKVVQYDRATKTYYMTGKILPVNDINNFDTTNKEAYDSIDSEEIKIRYMAYDDGGNDYAENYLDWTPCQQIGALPYRYIGQVTSDNPQAEQFGYAGIECNVGYRKNIDGDNVFGIWDDSSYVARCGRDGMRDNQAHYCFNMAGGSCFANENNVGPQAKELFFYTRAEIENFPDKYAVEKTKLLADVQPCLVDFVKYWHGADSATILTVAIEEPYIIGRLPSIDCTYQYSYPGGSPIDGSYTGFSDLVPPVIAFFNAFAKTCKYFESSVYRGQSTIADLQVDSAVAFTIDSDNMTSGIDYSNTSNNNQFRSPVVQLPSVQFPLIH